MLELLCNYLMHVEVITSQGLYPWIRGSSLPYNQKP